MSLLLNKCSPHINRMAIPCKRFVSSLCNFISTLTFHYSENSPFVTPIILASPRIIISIALSVIDVHNSYISTIVFAYCFDNYKSCNLPSINFPVATHMQNAIRNFPINNTIDIIPLNLRSHNIRRKTQNP